ncbi:hypothetical protein HZS_3059 [Henneguya salminicola]|nr:hypothetical protein HZS_3059 [Henneguya salminicola]
MVDFEKTFENLDVKKNVIQQSIGDSTASSIPMETVDNMLEQIANEAGLEVQYSLPVASSNAPQAVAPNKTNPQEEDELVKRLNRLRQINE